MKDGAEAELEEMVEVAAGRAGVQDMLDVPLDNSRYNEYYGFVLRRQR